MTREGSSEADIRRRLINTSHDSYLRLGILQLLSDHISDAFWIITQDGRSLIFVSQAYENIWGRSCESLYDDPSTWLRACHEDDKEALSEAWNKALAEGTNFDATYRIVRPDGSIRWVRDRGFPVLDERQVRQFFCGIAQDITDEKMASDQRLAIAERERALVEAERHAQKRTAELMEQTVRERTAELETVNLRLQKEVEERRRTEAELKLSEERFRRAFEDAAVGMALLSTEGGYLQVNQALCNMLGICEAELLAMSAHEITHPEDMERTQRAFSDLLAGGVQSVTMEKRCRHSRGHYIWSTLSVSLVRDDQGRPAYFVVQAQDITEAKLAQVLTEQHKLMQQREDFMAMLTHDLKNPLIGANRILELFADGKLGDLTAEQKVLITQVRNSNNGLLEIIQNLLQVYRYERDSRSLTLEPVDLFATIASAVESMETLASDKSISLSIVSERKALSPVMAEEASIRRVFHNLLDNALKFTTTGGRITITAKETADSVIFTFEDTGPGIAPEDIPLLFERFWQGGRGRRYAPGTGLGLYISRRIIEGHGGTITCQSAVGLGTTFTITLPRLVAPAEFFPAG